MTDSLPLTQNDISIDSLIDALLDVEETFPAKYLYRLSDLSQNDVEAIKDIWPKIPDWRRKALIEDTETLFDRDYLLSYEALCKIGIDDDDPHVRFLCLRSLGGYEVPDLIPRFIEFMEKDGDHEVREIAATLLGKYVYMGEIESLSRERLAMITDHLLDVFHGEDRASIRQKALEALGYSSRENMPKLIKQAYQQSKPEWKASAVNAMGKSYNKQFSKTILRELNSENERLRLEAVRAAGELELTQATPELIDYLDDSNVDLRLTAVWALSQIGGTRAKKAIEALLADDIPEEELIVIQEALEYLEFNDSIDLDDLDDFDDSDFFD